MPGPGDPRAGPGDHAAHTQPRVSASPSARDSVEIAGDVLEQGKAAGVDAGDTAGFGRGESARERAEDDEMRDRKDQADSEASRPIDLRTAKISPLRRAVTKTTT